MQLHAACSRRQGGPARGRAIGAHCVAASGEARDEAIQAFQLLCSRGGHRLEAGLRVRRNGPAALKAPHLRVGGSAHPVRRACRNAHITRWAAMAAVSEGRKGKK
jgi:hypothetical protein